MKLTPEKLLQMLKPTDLIFTSEGNFRVVDKSEKEINLEIMRGGGKA